ncbi:universal stress protein [Carboxylicivirga sediminis]|uniref:Universal stress protein n=1 Tax=Carboxylicivirga sediminis TaxID=2006564 RepID=A0A941F2Z2_9BACT|nr:universal stress protein [Carboxylicivirga sediminis]MBR8535781.1 universal stress protein [Carboxylicivirga sediminis]
MKRVIIALDFDPSAQKVAEEGYALAKALKAKVTLVHVKATADYYSSLGQVVVIGFSGHLKDDTPIAPEKIDPDVISQEFLKKAMLHLADKNIEVMVANGSCADSLIDVAKQLNAYMIVMGSHSRKWFENTTIGSVTQKVLLGSSIPVFVIPTN